MITSIGRALVLVFLPGLRLLAWMIAAHAGQMPLRSIGRMHQAQWLRLVFTSCGSQLRVSLKNRSISACGMTLLRRAVLDRSKPRLRSRYTVSRQTPRCAAASSGE